MFKRLRFSAAAELRGETSAADGPLANSAIKPAASHDARTGKARIEVRTVAADNMEQNARIFEKDSPRILIHDTSFPRGARDARHLDSTVGGIGPALLVVESNPTVDEANFAVKREASVISPGRSISIGSVSR